MLWKMTCGIANEFGRDIDMAGQPPYSPEVYEFVFGQILKHRHFVPLIIDEVYDVPEQDEDSLHADDSVKADPQTADHYGKLIIENYSETQIDKIVDNWYNT